MIVHKRNEFNFAEVNAERAAVLLFHSKNMCSLLPFSVKILCRTEWCVVSFFSSPPSMPQYSSSTAGMEMERVISHVSCSHD